ncbi:unnamed protein product [Ranitomeya imitator]|uniref:VWFA domain-containing protein n=1 Tax=Ranitomeya imitator TaxID=111125 RepID=A0ABN9LG60_9NEOB|nr:unnamed protein product [Ranitomeya imitator]
MPTIGAIADRGHLTPLMPLPDQTSDVLSDYLLQCILGKNIKIHIVAFDSNGQADLQALAEAVGARFHCFSSWNEDEIYASTDIKVLYKEVQKAIDVLNKIKELRQGKLDDTCISIIQKISTEVAKIPPSAFLPKPPNHSAPLNIKIPHFLPRTSSEWLLKNGLRAKKMSLYQVLAPNAYSTVEEFVPILQKTVSSTLLERAMMQFEWHDGTVKNIHVDPPVLYDYQKQLAKMARTYEKRIDWLTKGSRRQWGTVCEKRAEQSTPVPEPWLKIRRGRLVMKMGGAAADQRRPSDRTSSGTAPGVVLLVDLSLENALHIIHIQHSLRLLLEEQMANKDLFNIIVFGSGIHVWKEGMVPTTSENLQNAWKWVLTLECEGSRNTLSAIKTAIEGNFMDKENQESQGMYLFTSGIPDQDVNAVHAYLSEAVSGCDLQLHAGLFTVREDGGNDRSDAARVLQDLAHVTNGRFHWFNDTDVIESDDIRSLVSEMEKAVNYSNKCAYLVEALKYRARAKDESLSPANASEVSSQKEKQKPKKLPLPKPTALTLARMGLREDEEGKKDPNLKALLWRPNSAKADIPPAQPFKDWGFTNDKKAKKKKSAKTSISSFYTENGKDIGVVYKDYPKTKTVRKSVPFIVLPKEEDVCSTKSISGSGKSSTGVVRVHMYIIHGSSVCTIRVIRNGIELTDF